MIFCNPNLDDSLFAHLIPPFVAGPVSCANLLTAVDREIISNYPVPDIPLPNFTLPLNPNISMKT